MDPLSHEPDRPCVLRLDDVDPVGWDDPDRGVLSFRTLFGDGTPTSRLTLGVATLPPAGWLARHRHAQAELYLVTEGTGVAHLDGTDHEVTPGTALFIPGDAEHGIANTGSVDLRFTYVLAADRFADVVYEFGPPRT